MSAFRGVATGMFMVGMLCALAGADAPASAPAVRTAGKATGHCSAVEVERKTFDPRDPAKGGAPLKGHEVAVCVGESHAAISFSSEKTYVKKVDDGYEAGVKVPWATLKCSMKIIVWLPEGAPPWLKEHEEGHREIYQKVYEALSEKAAVAAGKNAAGKTFVGTGKTTLEAERDAIARAQASITDDYNTHACAVWARVNDIYDTITRHGSLSIPGAKDGVTSDKARERAFEVYANQVDAVEDAKKLAGPTTQKAR